MLVTLALSLFLQTQVFRPEALPEAPRLLLGRLTPPNPCDGFTQPVGRGAVGDLNHDGLPDFLTAFRAYLGTARGTLVPGAATPPFSHYAPMVQAVVNRHVGPNLAVGRIPRIKADQFTGPDAGNGFNIRMPPIMSGSRVVFQTRVAIDGDVLHQRSVALSR